MRRSLLATLALLACTATPPQPADPPPLGKLPGDVRPLHYRVALSVVPGAERYSGSVLIELELDRARDVIWLHGRGLHVARASVRTEGATVQSASWEEIPDSEGVAALRPERRVGPGRVALELEFDAAFGRQLRGLYRVDLEGRSYAFTQFEPTAAREAFPCFDEPAFKTPFDVELTVPAAEAAISNTRELERRPAPGGLELVRFATTEKLPTYLVAFAVGPLDVVDAPPLPPSALRDHPIPLRGVAARGRGPQLAYALANTRRIVEALERYFGIPYPFDKLDLIAVPDFAMGAMENAGAITYRESLLLIDEASAPEDQKRGFASVHAHELAHQWVGDLVTMPWWDDIWLNEAFATWMAAKIVDEVRPEDRAGIGLLLAVQWAMGADSLVSARSIRQPIASSHDIHNAFDAITYQKGASVLAMFERWIGAEAFRAGIHRYLEAHRFGNATSADLLTALSDASGRDVASPFHTFLDQPGVPFLGVEKRCEDGRAHLSLRQSRFLPAGSAAERGGIWRVPVCARFWTGGAAQEACTLLAGAEGELELGNECPAGVLPNADGAGYYRWSRPAAELATPTGASLRERISAADALLSGFSAGSLGAADVFGALAPLARDPDRAVARAPMGLLRFARDSLVSAPVRPAVESFARALYAPAMARLGWGPKADDDGEARLFRAEVIEFLSEVGRDRAVREKLAALGRPLLGFGPHTGEPAPELVDAALVTAIEDGDARTWEAAEQELHRSTDALGRSRLLAALGSTADPALAERARQLALDPRLRVNEVTLPLGVQMRDPRTRDAAWSWLTTHWDELVARLSERGSGGMPWFTAAFCDAAQAADAQTFFEPRIQALPGGPRNLAGATETARLCAASVALQRASAEEFFSRARTRGAS